MMDQGITAGKRTWAKATIETRINFWNESSLEGLFQSDFRKKELTTTKYKERGKEKTEFEKQKKKMRQREHIRMGVCVSLSIPIS